MSWGNMFYSPVSHVQHSKYVYLSSFAGIESEEDPLMPRNLTILSKSLMEYAGGLGWNSYVLVVICLLTPFSFNQYVNMKESTGVAVWFYSS